MDNRTPSVTIHCVVEYENTGYSGQMLVQQRALDAVLFDFNPSANPKVARIKALSAALIQEMHDLQAAPTSTPAQKRVAAIAITDLEKVQMVAVKALFAKA